MQAITEEIKNVLAQIKNASGAFIGKSISNILLQEGHLICEIKTDNPSDFSNVQGEVERAFQGSSTIKKVTVVLTEQVAPKIENTGKKQPVFGVKKCIVVASGKGGVGKSTVAANLAVELANRGFRVGLVDVDIYGPSIAKMFAISHKPALEDDLMVPHSKFGVKLMSIGFLVDEGNAVVWRGPMTTKMLYQLIRLSKWSDQRGELDYLIIDTPPGTGDVHLSLAENYVIDGVIVVTTPQEIAVIDALKAVDMFKKVDTKIIGVIENMSYLAMPDGSKEFIFGKGGGARLAEKSGLKLLGELPIFKQIGANSDIGKPFMAIRMEENVRKPFEMFVDNVLNANKI